MSAFIAANDANPLVNGRIQTRHIYTALAVALVLHLAALVLWAVYRNPLPDLIEVKVMNLKMGSGGEIFVDRPEKSVTVEQQRRRPRPQRQPSPASNAAALSESRVQKPPKEAAPVATESFPEITPRSKPPAPAVKHEEPAKQATETSEKTAAPQVQAVPPIAPVKQSPSSKLKIRQIMERYEQLLSGWIKTHKLYPATLKEQGVEGIGAVRIRIDRRGQILHKRIEQATGQAQLDKAMLDMIDRSNPVPAVPDKLDGNAFEFIVPITFFATSEE